MYFRITLLLLVLLSACKKDSPINQQTFVGEVRDYSSRDGVSPVPVPHAVVQLIKADGASGYGSSFTLTNPVYSYSVSDDDGIFGFTEPADSKKFFVVRGSKTGYVFIDHSDIQQLPSTKIIYSHIVYLDKASIVKIIFHDISSSSINDSILLTCEYSSDQNVFGASVNTIITHSGSISHNQTVSFTDSISGTTYASAQLMWTVGTTNHILSYGNHYYPVNQFGIKIIDIFF